VSEPGDRGRLFSDPGELEGHVVDSSGQIPEATATELAVALDGNRFTPWATGAVSVRC
jgi:hypothetical protein